MSGKTAAAAESASIAGSFWNYFWNSSVQLEGKKGPQSHATEFHQMQAEFISEDVKSFIERYPLISTISMIAFGFFGLMNVLSFSPTNILTGAFLLTLAFSLGKGIWNQGIWGHLIGVKNAVFAFMENRTGDNKKQDAPKPVKT